MIEATEYKNIFRNKRSTTRLNLCNLIIHDHVKSVKKQIDNDQNSYIIITGINGPPTAPCISCMLVQHTYSLFLCFINDLPNRITSNIKLYADDVLLYATIRSPDDCCRLQQDLNTLEQWASDWKMSFNLQKCEFLRITNKRQPILSQYTLQNQSIKEVTCAKYLGVTIDKNLSWSEHIKQITKRLIM